MLWHSQVLIITDDWRKRHMIRSAIEGLCDVVAPTSHSEVTVALTEYSQRFEEDNGLYSVVILDSIFTLWKPKDPPGLGK